MTDANTHFNPWPKVIAVVSPDLELAVHFVQDICGSPPEKEMAAETVIRNEKVCLKILAGHPSQFPEWERDVRVADGLLLLTRFLDRDSLDQVRQIVARLPVHSKQPLSVLFARNEGEMEFKLSCPACSQKLWIRDREVGKQGRCPNCERVFQTPSQAGLLRMQLMLPPEIPVVKIIRGNAAACRGALISLLQRIETTSGGLDQETKLEEPALEIDPAEHGLPVKKPTQAARDIESTSSIEERLPVQRATVESAEKLRSKPGSKIRIKSSGSSAAMRIKPKGKEGFKIKAGTNRNPESSD